MDELVDEEIAKLARVIRDRGMDNETAAAFYEDLIARLEAEVQMLLDSDDTIPG